MIGVTLFGLFLTPVFYVGLRKLSGRSLIHHGEAGLSHGWSRQARGTGDVFGKGRDFGRKCLKQLSPAHQEIIDLVYHHEKSIAEISEIVGAPQNTVKTRMFYARKKMAELLNAEGIDRVWS
jgi:hypothetical protein